MLSLEFPGCRKLVDALDAAIAQGTTEEITAALRRTLCDMIRAKDVQLPECVFEGMTDHYARRELYKSELHGYSVVAMTWGPNQGTPIHDHCGMWCVEGVWHGELEITQYDMVESGDGRFRFRPVGAIQAGPGSAGSLIPPHEYHTIRNPSERGNAVSLHIYKGTMTQCAVFSPLGDDWYERSTRQLDLDRTH